VSGPNPEPRSTEVIVKRAWELLTVDGPAPDPELYLDLAERLVQALEREHARAEAARPVIAAVYRAQYVLTSLNSIGDMSRYYPLLYGIAEAMKGYEAAAGEGGWLDEHYPDGRLRQGA
jgi:hypothetical protein